MKKNRNFIIGVVIFAGLFAVILFTQLKKSPVISIETAQGPVKVVVEVARTPQERIWGLMFRNELRDGHGMLFVYEKDYRPTMWMKNMMMPLDIIFIGSDLKINHIEKNTPPCEELNEDLCPRYRSEFPVNYVLELPADYVNANGIELGNVVTPTI